MEGNRIPKRVLYMNLGTTELRARPRNRWQDEVREDGRIVGGEGWQEKVLYKLSVCICSLRYPVCNAHAPYCQLWPVRLVQYCPALPHKRHDFRKNVTDDKTCVFIFSTSFV